MLCVALGAAGFGQKKPAWQGLAVEEVLARAKQQPGEHATHAPADVAAVPPKENVPAAQGFCEAAPVPAGQ